MEVFGVQRLQVNVVGVISLQMYVISSVMVTYISSVIITLLSWSDTVYIDRNA